jgi:hypothetical protein
MSSADGVTAGRADNKRDLFADTIRSYSTFINASVVPAHDCSGEVRSFADTIRSCSTFINASVVPAHDCSGEVRSFAAAIRSYSTFITPL